MAKLVTLLKLQCVSVLNDQGTVAAGVGVRAGYGYGWDRGRDWGRGSPTKVCLR